MLSAGQVPGSAQDGNCIFLPRVLGPGAASQVQISHQGFRRWRHLLQIKNCPFLPHGNLLTGQNASPPIAPSGLQGLKPLLSVFLTHCKLQVAALLGDSARASDLCRRTV